MARVAKFLIYHMFINVEDNGYHAANKKSFTPLLSDLNSTCLFYHLKADLVLKVPSGKVNVICKHINAC